MTSLCRFRQAGVFTALIRFFVVSSSLSTKEGENDTTKNLISALCAVRGSCACAVVYLPFLILKALEGRENSHVKLHRGHAQSFSYVQVVWVCLQAKPSFCHQPIAAPGAVPTLNTQCYSTLDIVQLAFTALTWLLFCGCSTVTLTLCLGLATAAQHTLPCHLTPVCLSTALLPLAPVPLFSSCSRRVRRQSLVQTAARAPVPSASLRWTLW